MADLKPSICTTRPLSPTATARSPLLAAAGDLTAPERPYTPLPDRPATPPRSPRRGIHKSACLRSAGTPLSPLRYGCSLREGMDNSAPPASPDEIRRVATPPQPPMPSHLYTGSSVATLVPKHDSTKSVRHIHTPTHDSADNEETPRHKKRAPESTPDVGVATPCASSLKAARSVQTYIPSSHVRVQQHVAGTPSLSSIAEVAATPDDDSTAMEDILIPSLSRRRKRSIPLRESILRILAPNRFFEIQLPRMPPSSRPPTPVVASAGEGGISSDRTSFWDTSEDPFVVVEPSPAVRQSWCLTPPSHAASDHHAHEATGGSPPSPSNVGYYYTLYGEIIDDPFTLPEGLELPEVLWYVVTAGRRVGVFRGYFRAQKHVLDLEKCMYRVFKVYAQALQYYNFKKDRQEIVILTY
ncbi:hypothetical protein GY45DRAFT_1341446 [Cubamyces sp. BRFM 1775]|nr:hypothetical protein GY45DRAFT_1341446 [Cubamyces sp. BRFM 1775]